MKLEFLEDGFSICKLTGVCEADLSCPLFFLSRTDRETSLVCPTPLAPQNCVAREDGWRGFRFAGTLEFSLIGILARVTALLAERRIGLFAVSTFDTDYVFFREQDGPAVRQALLAGGYTLAD